MKRRARDTDGTVSVSGPGYERAGLPNVGVGISAALTAATRLRAGTFYVRDGEQVHAHVSYDNGTIRVFPRW